MGSKAKNTTVDVVPTSIKDGVTAAVAGLIHQDTDPELGDFPRKKGYYPDVIILSWNNLEKVQKTQHLTTRKQVISFLGLVGYYRDHIPAFADISATLCDLKRGKSEEVQWNDSQEPVLKLPDRHIQS